MLISPIILAAGVIIIGLFPDLINKPFIEHAASAVGGTVIAEKIYFWHGIIPPFIMSIAVLVFGTILYLTRTKWAPVYKAVPGKLSLNKFYDGLVDRTERYSAVITNG
ncbi:hypothetical protein KSU19_22770, partial [Enterobacter quasiroggenkampii]|nr:hypothetical protein [Enterobacter quasiroggenkampii]